MPLIVLPLSVPLLLSQLVLAATSVQPVGTDSAALKVPANTVVLSLPPFFRPNVFGRMVLGGLAPFTVNENEVSVGSGDGIVTFLTISVPQFEMFTAIGAMKSFSSELKELPEERLFR